MTQCHVILCILCLFLLKTNNKWQICGNDCTMAMYNADAMCPDSCHSYLHQGVPSMNKTTYKGTYRLTNHVTVYKSKEKFRAHKFITRGPPAAGLVGPFPHHSQEISKVLLTLYCFDTMAAWKQYLVSSTALNHEMYDIIPIISSFWKSSEALTKRHILWGHP